MMFHKAEDENEHFDHNLKDVMQNSEQHKNIDR